MSTDDFWALIESCRKKSAADPEFLDALITELADKAVGDIVSYHAIFLQLQREAYDNLLWAAAHAMNGGCSREGFADFRAWLISQGRAVFEAAVKEPDSLADLSVKKGKGPHADARLPGMNHAAAQAYLKKTGNQDFNRLYDRLTRREPAPSLKHESVYWDGERDPDSMRKLVPKLMAKYWVPPGAVKQT